MTFRFKLRKVRSTCYLRIKLCFYLYDLFMSIFHLPSIRPSIQLDLLSFSEIFFSINFLVLRNHFTKLITFSDSLLIVPTCSLYPYSCPVTHLSHPFLVYTQTARSTSLRNHGLPLDQTSLLVEQEFLLCCLFRLPLGPSSTRVGFDCRH